MSATTPKAPKAFLPDDAQTPADSRNAVSASDGYSYVGVAVGYYGNDPEYPELDRSSYDEDERVGIWHPDGILRLTPAAARRVAELLVNAADEIDSPESDESAAPA